jgi:beta-phosphoglucomutase
MRSPVNAVIFDLDGVITDTARFHYLAWQKIAAELDIYFDEQSNEQLKGVDRMHSLQIILENAGKQLSEAEKSFWADRKNEYYKQLIEAMTSADTLPGTKELLNILKEKNIRVGLASISKNATTVINKLQIKGFFDYIADAAKIKKGKPDPEIFLTVAQNLKTQVENCIGVEDAAAGIKAIKAAGMYAVGVGNPQILGEADDVINGLEEFKIDKYVAVLG